MGFKFHWTWSRVILLLIMAVGALATFLRYSQGLGASTNLSDSYPWGLWIAFDVLCGVALAAGGFTAAATVYIFNLKKYHAIVRPAVLTGFIGYFLVAVGLLYDLGRPWFIWHPIIMWQHHSVMFEVAWCVMLYLTVLFLEFCPVIFERFRLEGALRVIHACTIPLVIMGIILSTLHQSSLGSLFLIVPGKLYPLWYSPFLPVFFFTSAVAVGLAMIVVESTLSSLAFKRGLETPLLADLTKALPFILVFYFVIKIADLAARGSLSLLFNGSYESISFLAELAIGVIVPASILSFRNLRQQTVWQFLSCLMVVCGVVLNRINVCLIGMSRSAGQGYVPAWTEFSITLALVSFGVMAYIWITENFPVFEDHGDKAGA